MPVQLVLHAPTETLTGARARRDYFSPGVRPRWTPGKNLPVARGGRADPAQGPCSTSCTGIYIVVPLQCTHAYIYSPVC